MTTAAERIAIAKAAITGLLLIFSRPAAKILAGAGVLFLGFWLYAFLSSAMIYAASKAVCSFAECSGKLVQAEAYASADGKTVYAGTPTFWDEYNATFLKAQYSPYFKYALAATPVGFEGPLIHRLLPRITAWKIGVPLDQPVETPPWQDAQGTANYFFLGLMIQLSFFAAGLLCFWLYPLCRNAALAAPAKAQSFARHALETGGLEEKLAKAQAQAIGNATKSGKRMSKNTSI